MNAKLQRQIALLRAEELRAPGTWDAILEELFKPVAQHWQEKYVPGATYDES